MSVYTSFQVDIETYEDKLGQSGDRIISSHLRNEFDFWKVHGIMNTSDLLQSK